MHKTFIATALALGMCLPVYAEQYTNSDSDRYSAPAFEDEAEDMTVNQAVPSRITEKGAEKEAQHDQAGNNDNARNGIGIIG